MSDAWKGRAMSAAAVVAHVRSNRTVFLHGAAATPLPLVEALGQHGAAGLGGGRMRGRRDPAAMAGAVQIDRCGHERDLAIRLLRRRGRGA